MMTEHEPSSPRIFAPSSLTIDDSKLCFNKNHFSRADFDVQRFMNLARRRAGLEQIQKDLRLYLKGVQHSMIELINDDYADFVHLSSNLVGLQSSIDKIEKDLQSIWFEFEKFTADSVGTAEQIELRCDQLAYNRRRQGDVRNKIVFLSALQRLHVLLNSKSTSVIWLEKIASCIADLILYEDIKSIDENRAEKKIYDRSFSKLEGILCKEGVRSASDECGSFPLVLSILSLMKSSHILTAALITNFLHPKLVSISNKENHEEQLTSVLNGVLSVREKWKTILGSRFSGSLKDFLDQTLLTFIVTFLEKCLAMIVVPNDTTVFHKCYQLIEQFIQQWPSATPSNKTLLKSIRDKFNFLVYFKLITFKATKQIESLCSSDKISFSETERMKCSVSSVILDTIEKIWSEDVFLFPLIEKFWDFTLKLLSKHFAWSQTISISLKTNSLSEDGTPKWKKLLAIRSDLKFLHSAVFDLCLEQIWTKLRDLDIETSLFGQCLTRNGQRIEKECVQLDQILLEIGTEEIAQELEAATDIAKHYRWTRKPTPTAPSQYVLSFLDKLQKMEGELQDVEMDSDEFISNIITKCLSTLLSRLRKVLEGTEIHSSSRLLSRKQVTLSAEGLSDNDKIKIQIYYDLEACRSYIHKKNVDFSDLLDILHKCKPNEEILRSAPSPLRNESPTLLNDSENVNKFSDDCYESTDLHDGSAHNQPSLLREGSA